MVFKCPLRKKGKVTLCHEQTALYELQSHHTENVGTLVCVVAMYLLSLLRKPQLCWHPLWRRSLVYRGPNGSLAGRKANAYWRLLNQSGLR